MFNTKQTILYREFFNFVDQFMATGELLAERCIRILPMKSVCMMANNIWNEGK
jgi:hypothetical protein